MSSLKNANFLQEKNRSIRLRKGSLIPLWVFQILIMLVIIGTDIYLETIAGELVPASLIIICICSFCAILDLTEIILFAASKLKAITYLVLQVVKTIIWFTIFVIAFVNVTNWERKASSTDGIGRDYQYELIIPIVEDAIPLVLFLASLIYGSLIYHRTRRANARSKFTQMPDDRLELGGDTDNIGQFGSDGTPISGPCKSDGSLVAGPYESDASPITGADGRNRQNMQQLEDERFIAELGPEGGR